MKITKEKRVNLLHKEMVTCKRCGRKLTNIYSIVRGYGDTCWKKKYKVIPLKPNVTS